MFNSLLSKKGEFYAPIYKPRGEKTQIFITLFNFWILFFFKKKNQLKIHAFFMIFIGLGGIINLSEFFPFIISILNPSNDE